MGKIRLIHLGLGRWGFDWARHVYPSHPEIEAVAYVDQDAAARERGRAILGAPASAFFSGLTEALAAIEADAVVISLPTALHAPLAAEAIEADKHVIVEKPFTATLAEAHCLVDLAEARGRTLMVSQNYRYYPAPQAAAHFVREGHFGHLTSVKIDFRRHAPMEGYSYWDLPNPLLVDMAVHHYDLMRMVIGQDPAELSCRTWNPPGSPFKMAPCGAIVLSYPSDVVVSYRGSWLDQGPQTAWAGEWQMDFEQGSVLWTSRGDRPNPTRRDRMRIRRLNAEMEEVDLAPLPMHDRAGALAAFAAAVRTGSEPAFFPSGRANLATLAIVEATLKSSVAGGASVRLDSFYPDNGRSLK